MEYRVHFKTKHVLAVDKANTLTLKQLFLYIDKKEEIWLSPMTKAPTPTEMSKGQWQHKQRHKTGF